MTDWLADFVKYSSYGEASPRLMYWVGVSTIAAALRRKVWFDQEDFQWSPNFYILIVGPPGTVRKSTSIDIGMKLLRQIEGINMGPSIITWQALIEYIAGCKEEVELEGGEIFEMSCVTLALSEFGSFFDPENRELVDNLTDLWDGKLGTIEKKTKTAGDDSMVNPWINLIAATTPKWLAENFGDGLVGGGLAGRFIFLYGEMPNKDVAYPKRHMPERIARRGEANRLVRGLADMAALRGEMELTEEAYKWGEEWYDEQRAKLRKIGLDSLEAGFIVRKQVHLHKLAMVVSVSRGHFPTVVLDDLLEAEARLKDLDTDMRKVFGFVGQTKITSASREIVEVVVREGRIEKRKLYKLHFHRTMEVTEFDRALASAIQAELITETGDVAHPYLTVR